MDIVVILCWIVCGLIVGLIARWLVPSAVPMGILRTILVGIVGAFVGGLLHQALFGTAAPLSFSAAAWQGWLFAILGAIIVVLLYSWWERKRSWSGWW